MLNMRDKFIKIMWPVLSFLGQHGNMVRFLQIQSNVRRDYIYSKVKMYLITYKIPIPPQSVKFQFCEVKRFLMMVFKLEIILI